METENRMTAIIEHRQGGEGSAGVLLATVANYGTIADVGGLFRERILPGAFGDPQDVIVNVQHERQVPLARSGAGGLALLDSQAAMLATIDMPDTQAGRDTFTLVQRQVLRGVSVEMRVRDETWNADLRTIIRAELRGLAIVDRPAYSDSEIEVMRAWLVPIAQANRGIRRWR